jgi:hypothetical protein
VDVEVVHFLDAGEQDAQGEYDYYYEGDTFTFSWPGERPAVARIYTYDTAAAVFVGFSCRQAEASPLASEAARYLASKGIATFRAVGPSGAYEAWKPRLSG